MGADGSMVGKVRTAARRVPLLRSVYRATRAELAARGFGAYADSTWNAIPNAVTVATIEGDTSVRVVGELGVFKGATTEAIARIIGPRDGVLHLFDFEDVVAPVAAHIARMGVSVVPHVNSHHSMDSYCWALMRLLELHEQPLFDYVYFDGAHTWHHDGFAFLLVDRLLRPGGYVDFDDFDWRLVDQPELTVLPDGRAIRTPMSLHRLYRAHYTREQLETPQVARVIDLLVRRSGYDEVVVNKVFRKPGGSDA